MAERARLREPPPAPAGGPVERQAGRRPARVERPGAQPHDATVPGPRTTRPTGNAAAARAGAARSEIRPKLSVTRVDDPVEREADAVAARVLARAPVPSAPTDAPAAAGRAAAARVEGGGGADGAPGGDGVPDVPPALEAYISGVSGGDPLQAEVRDTIEPHLGADLTDVRVHADDTAAAAAAQLQARAFTFGKHIFLAAGESAADVALMAHEATHVVQQGAVEVYRSGGTLMREGPAAAAVQEEEDDDWFDIPDFILEGVSEAASAIPGYTLLTQIVGTDPITGDAVSTERESLTDTLLTFVPALFGPAVGPLLSTVDVLSDVFTLITDGLQAHDLTLRRLADDIAAAWDEFSVSNGIDGNVEIVSRYVGALVADVRAFVSDIAQAVIDAVRAVVATVARPLLETEQIAPLWSLTKKVIGTDPLSGETVDVPTVEILGDFLDLIGKSEVKDQMTERGTLKKTADWLDEQLGTFKGLVGELAAIFAAAWEAIQPQNLVNLFDNLADLAGRVFALIQRVRDFAATIMLTVLDLVKDSLLGWLSREAHELPGFHLVTVILEKNPFTGEEVPRAAENIIRGFISLLPGGNEMYDKLAESGVVGEAAGRIEGAMASLGISWELVTGIFAGIWDTISLESLLDPIGTFSRILDLFGEPLGRVLGFVVVVMQEVVTLILAMMNFPSELLGSIIANAVQAIDDIMADPIGFLVNMLEALRQGFTGFIGNVVGYLVQGLADWLFRGLGELGVTVPTDLSFQSVLDTVLQVLGISEEVLWRKLADQIGQDKVDTIRGAVDQLTGAWQFIKDVQERGLIAIWEYIEGQLSNLWDLILSKAKDWVVSEIIDKVTSKLLSMLDPTGVMAIVNSFVAFFNAIQSAIEYLREILEIVDAYVSTLAAVASGNVAPGAAMLEGGLAAAIPVAIGFLANQVGLGNVPEKIVEIIQGLRVLIDQALDWLFAQAMRMGRAALEALGIGGEGADAGAGDAIDEPVPLRGQMHHLVNDGPDGALVLHSAATLISTIKDVELQTLVAAYNRVKSRDGRKAAAHEIAAWIRENNPTGGYGGSAPGLGNTARHGRQPTRLNEAGLPLWILRSEHVIPFDVIRGLWQAVGTHSHEVDRPAMRAEDNQLTTIMIYYGAANEKNTTEAGRRSGKARAVEAQAEAYWADPGAGGGEAERALRISIMEALNGELPYYTDLTSRLVKKEHATVLGSETHGALRLEATALPGKDDIQAAGEQEIDDAERLLKAALAELAPPPRRSNRPSKAG